MIGHKMLLGAANPQRRCPSNLKALKYSETMNRKLRLDDVLQQILKEQEYITPAAEEMRQYLNEVVSTHNLSGTQVLLMMSRLSAAYIQSLKKHFYNEEAKEAVEVLFYDSLAAHLSLVSLKDRQQNIELN